MFLSLEIGALSLGLTRSQVSVSLVDKPYALVLRPFASLSCLITMSTSQSTHW